MTVPDAEQTVARPSKRQCLGTVVVNAAARLAMGNVSSISTTASLTQQASASKKRPAEGGPKNQPAKKKHKK
jgi:hypothetical protein